MVFKRIRLCMGIVSFAISMIGWRLSFELSKRKSRKDARLIQAASDGKSRNIVVVGVSFGGLALLNDLVGALPPNSTWKIVAIEPRSHFHFTWVLPRFSVVDGHDDIAFIPYGPTMKAGEGKSTLVHDRATEVRRDSVLLESGSEIDYAFLVVATGTKAGLRRPAQHRRGRQ